MNKDQAEGHTKDLKGTVKEAVGQATGSENTEAEGRAEKTEGKLQKTVGDVKDVLRDK